MKFYRAELRDGTHTGTKRDIMKFGRLSSIDWERGIEMDRITEVSDETFTGPQPFPF